MISRLTNAIGVVVRETSSYAGGMSFPFQKRLLTPTTPSIELARVPLSHSHRVNRITFWQNYSHLTHFHSFKLLDLQPIPERVVFNTFSPATPFPLYSQQRRFSTMPTDSSTLKSKWPYFANAASNLRKRKFPIKSIAFLALSYLIGRQIYIEHLRKIESDRIEKSLGERPEDAERIVDLKEFKKRFNEAKGDALDPLQDEAFVQIRHWRYISGLTPLTPINKDIKMAIDAFMVLAQCNDPLIQRESVKYLITLLKTPINPYLRIEEPLWLLEDLSGLIDNENHKDVIPVPFIQDLATAYALVLEKIFLFSVEYGRQISTDRVLRIKKKAEEMQAKLKGNPAFEYQARNAEVIAKHIPTPDQPLNDIETALSEIASASIKLKIRTFPILQRDNQNQNCVKIYINNTEEYAKIINDNFALLEKVWNNNKDNLLFCESLFLLRPCFSVDQIKKEDIIETSRFMQEIYDNKLDWTIIYRLVDILSDIILSDLPFELREVAYKEVDSFIKSKTPRQVIIKIWTILDSLKLDHSFAPFVEDALSRIEELEQSKNSDRSYRGAQRRQSADKQIDKVIDSRFGFRPLKDSILEGVLNSLLPAKKLIICRNDVHSAIFEEFKKINYTTTRGLILLKGEENVGKSTEAAIYIKEHGNDYKYVEWINANQLKDDLEKIAANLQVNVSKLKEYFEKKENKGWLLVIDNVDLNSWNAVSEIIPSYGGHILLISKENTDINGMQIDHEITIQKPFEDEAKAFILESRIKKNSLQIDTPTVYQILSKCGILLNASFLANLSDDIRKSGLDLTQFEIDLTPEKISQINGVVENEKLDKKISDLKNLKAKNLLTFLSFLYLSKIPDFVVNEWLKKQGAGKNITELLIKEKLLFLNQDNSYSMNPILSNRLKKDLETSQKLEYIQNAIEILAEHIKDSLMNQKDLINNIENIRASFNIVFDAIKKDLSFLNDWKETQRFQILLCVMAFASYNTFFSDESEERKELFLKANEIMNLISGSFSQEDDTSALYRSLFGHLDFEGKSGNHTWTLYYHFKKNSQVILESFSKADRNTEAWSSYDFVDMILKSFNVFLSKYKELNEYEFLDEAFNSSSEDSHLILLLDKIINKNSLIINANTTEISDQEALRRLRYFLGAARLFYKLGINTLFQVDVRKGHYQKAKEMYEKAIQIYGTRWDSPGNHKPIGVHIYSGLAEVRHLLGEENYIVNQSKAYEIAKDLYVLGDPILTREYNRLEAFKTAE